jgi:hypothetical protein
MWKYPVIMANVYSIKPIPDVMLLMPPVITAKSSSITESVYRKPTMFAVILSKVAGIPGKVPVITVVSGVNLSVDTVAL